MRDVRRVGIVSDRVTDPNCPAVQGVQRGSIRRMTFHAVAQAAASERDRRCSTRAAAEDAARRAEQQRAWAFEAAYPDALVTLYRFCRDAGLVLEPYGAPTIAGAAGAAGPAQDGRAWMGARPVGLR